MPATTTSTKTPKPRAKATRKPAATKATAAKAAASKRASTNGTATAKATTTDAFGDYAERAVLIPVGAALIARERVVSTVSDTISTYGSTSKTQAQLRRFERRGVTARNRLEREVRKARVRVERQLRQRRRGFESTVSELEERRDAFAKSGSDLANRVPELASKVQERLLSLV
jgi:hypothetical protein